MRLAARSTGVLGLIRGPRPRNALPARVGEDVAAADAGSAQSPAREEPAVGEGSRLGRNIAALAGGQIVTWTMTLAWTLVVPRLLGPAGMGTIVTAWAVTGILAIALGFGTKNYLVRAIVVRKDQAPELVATAMMFRLVLTPVFALAVGVWAYFAHYGPDGTLALFLAGGATIFMLLAEPMQAAFQAIERMKYLAYSDVINKSVQGLLGIVLVLLGLGAVGFTGCWMVMSAVVLVLDAIWLRRYVRLEWRSNVRRVVRMAKESLAYWAFGLFFMVYLWIDAAMLSLMTNSTVVGWYGVPTKLFQSLMVVPVLVSTAWLPRLVSVFERSPSELAKAARTPIEIVLVLGVPIAAGLAVVAAPLIETIYGPAYGHAVPVMIILGLCIPPMYLNIMLSQVLIAAKRQVVWTWVMAGATIFNPALNALLIPMTESRLHNGAIGAAISLLATELVIVCAGIVLAGRGIISRRAIRRFSLTAVASSAMWGVSVAARGSGEIPSIALAIATFFLLAIILRLATPTEIEWARDRVRRATAWLSNRLRRRIAASSSRDDVSVGSQSP
jgi:O-antigen/teichoic acid export membrane protein